MRITPPELPSRDIARAKAERKIVINNNHHPPPVLKTLSSNWPFSGHLVSLSGQNCNNNNKYSNLTVRLTISQEQSWLSGLLVYLISHKCWFMGLAFFLDKIHNLLVKYCFVQNSRFFCWDTFKNYLEHCPPHEYKMR